MVADEDQYQDRASRAVVRPLHHEDNDACAERKGVDGARDEPPQLTLQLDTTPVTGKEQPAECELVPSLRVQDGKVEDKGVEGAHREIVLPIRWRVRNKGAEKAPGEIVLPIRGQVMVVDEQGAELEADEAERDLELGLSASGHMIASDDSLDKQHADRGAAATKGKGKEKETLTSSAHEDLEIQADDNTYHGRGQPDGGEDLDFSVGCVGVCLDLEKFEVFPPIGLPPPVVKEVFKLSLPRDQARPQRIPRVARQAVGDPGSLHRC